MFTSYFCMERHLTYTSATKVSLSYLGIANRKKAPIQTLSKTETAPSSAKSFLLLHSIRRYWTIPTLSTRWRRYSKMMKTMMTLPKQKLRKTLKMKKRSHLTLTKSWMTCRHPSTSKRRGRSWMRATSNFKWRIIISFTHLRVEASTLSSTCFKIS